MNTGEMDTRLEDMLVAQPLRETRARAFFGFDGFVDSIKRAVQFRDGTGKKVFFPTIADFGLHLAAQAGKSADYDVVTQYKKIGGNAPIAAHAAASLGIPTTCAGALGYPDPHELFGGEIAGLRLLSFADPGITDAFEFDDGKLMFGESASLAKITWELAVSRLADQGHDLIGEIAASDLIGVLNWASVHHMQGFLRGILSEVASRCGPEKFKTKILFFDLADITGCDPSLVKTWFVAMQAAPCRTVLSLNLKEAQFVGSLVLERVEVDPLDLGAELCLRLGVSIVVIHDRPAAYASDGRLRHTADSFFVEKPLVSTGAGDNFNAGFCWGLLNGLPLELSLRLANAVASLYVRSGISPTIDAVLGLVREHNLTLVALEN